MKQENCDVFKDSKGLEQAKFDLSHHVCVWVQKSLSCILYLLSIDLHHVLVQFCSLAPYGRVLPCDYLTSADSWCFVDNFFPAKGTE